MTILVAACAQTAAPPPTPTSMPPTPTTRPVPPPTAASAPATPTPQRDNLRTFHTNLSFETYETEETVSLELGQLPGVVSFSVTQLDVTVQYDPTRLSEDEILRTLRNNPEVRIRDDHPGQ